MSLLLGALMMVQLVTIAVVALRQVVRDEWLFAGAVVVLILAVVLFFAGLSLLLAWKP